MARIASYADLQAAISEWLGRSGDTALAGRADEFIGLFEAEFVLDPEMRTFDMEEVDTTPISDTDPIALPDGYLEMKRLRVVDADGLPVRKLNYVTPDRAAEIDETQRAGNACNYTVLAGQVVFAPQALAPVDDYLEMAYYAFAPLSVSNTSNWLLTKYTNIYLYGSLMQAAAYIDDKDTVNFWSGAYNTAIAKLGLSDKKRHQGAGPLTIRPSTKVFK